MSLLSMKRLSRFMGDKKPEESLGKILYWNDKPYPVVGVVADFHTSSLHDPITPLCIINRPDRESSLAIKLASTGRQSGMIKATLSQIEKAWKQIYPAATFNYRFYDESLALLYEKDRQTATSDKYCHADYHFYFLYGFVWSRCLPLKKEKKKLAYVKCSVQVSPILLTC